MFYLSHRIAGEERSMKGIPYLGMQQSWHHDMSACLITMSYFFLPLLWLSVEPISILKILSVFLWLKFPPSLILNPDVIGKHFENASVPYPLDINTLAPLCQKPMF